MKMLLRIAALQLSILNTRCMQAVSAEGLLKLNVDFGISYVYLENSPDWFLNFDCCLLNFQRHTLYLAFKWL